MGQTVASQIIEYHQVTGRIAELHRRFEADGLTFDDLQSPIDDPELRRKIVKAWKGEVEVIETKKKEFSPDIGYSEKFFYRTAAEQLDFWHSKLPDLNGSHVLRLAGQTKFRSQEMPIAVIPKFSVLADGSYLEAYKIIHLIALKSVKIDLNFQDVKTAKHWQRKASNIRALKFYDSQFPGDYLVFPFQFGNLHRNKSLDEVTASLSKGEFHLGPYELTALLATHPDRLTGKKQLSINAGGLGYGQPGVDSMAAFYVYFWHENDECVSLAPIGWPTNNASQIHDTEFSSTPTGFQI